MAVQEDDDDLNVSWYVSYFEVTKKHTIGKMDFSTGLFSERTATHEWRGYADFFDYESPFFYATMRRKAIYLHATVSGFVDGSGLIDTSYPQKPSVLPNDLAVNIFNIDLDDLTDQFTPLPMAIATVLESDEGLSR